MSRSFRWRSLAGAMALVLPLTGASPALAAPQAESVLALLSSAEISERIDEIPASQVTLAAESHLEEPEAEGAAIAATSVATASVMLAGSPAMAVGAVGNGRGNDITDTSRGQQAVARLADLSAQFGASTGVKLDRAAYQVVEGIAGDPNAIWVLPKASELPAIQTTPSGVSVIVAAEPEATAESTSAAAVVPLASKGIAWQSPYCYSRYTEAVGWLDHCRQFAQVTYDGDSSRDHWVLKLYGTCKGNSGWWMQRCQLASVKNGTTTQYWEDWSPKSDTSGGCRSISISVSAFGVGVSGNYTGCETSDITKGSAAGSFTSAWASSGVSQSERAVQSQIAVGVPNGQLPSYTLSWDISGVLIL